MTESFLDRIRRHKQAEIDSLRRRTVATQRVPAGARRSLRNALQGAGLSMIAEIKRASPSRGTLRPELDPATVARSYQGAGAAAVSVLTDASFFGARPDDLAAARAAIKTPVLRKDFILDPAQIEETVSMGADAVLLIVRMLDITLLRDLLQQATESGLETLVEVHDVDEVHTALHAGARIVGVNSRDLATFEVDLNTALSVRPSIPSDVVSVAESGIRNEDDLRRVCDAGFDAALCGEALMCSDDPGTGLRDLLTGAR
ncbi:MAG: indole-3-glycerol phosphate synthase TrpC [Acidobacteriota bacterium]|nr:indole-3-glycerol phosphate synthase TrpC [Acidobacteriota bacterium]MDH3784064.1 indole-3-glycerol phosphate synthase TrpC [Acidobacteriota bacterium]